jgi:hypothetical protein
MSEPKDVDDLTHEWSLSKSQEALEKFKKRPSKRTAAELKQWKGRHKMEIRDIDRKLAQDFPGIDASGEEWKDK